MSCAAPDGAGLEVIADWPSMSEFAAGQRPAREAGTRRCPIRGELSLRRRRRLGEPMGDEPTEPAAPEDPAEAIRRAAVEQDASGMSRRLLRSTGPRLLRDIL